MSSNNFVDFRAVKAAVTMVMTLDHYGVNWLRKKGDELRGRCPIHKGEGTDTFHVNVTKNAFHCFSCKARGNVLDLVAAIEQCTVKEAASKLVAWFNLASSGELATHAASTETRPSKQAERAQDLQLANKPLTFELKGLDYAHPYLAQRGIARALASEFGIGYFPGKGSMAGRVVIPIHNERGQLVAYAGRAIDGSEPKYKLPAGFHKSLELFNLHRAITLAAENPARTSIVVEGFFDCLTVHRSGWPCVALMGCSMSDQQAALLADHFTGVVLMLDGDAAGQGATDECLVKLGRRGLWVKTILLGHDKQPEMLAEEELEEIIG